MKKLLLLLFVISVAGSAYGEGYQVNLQSTKQAGMAHTGTGLKLGAESMHFNPAGLIYLNKSVDLSAGISAVMPTAKFSDASGYRHKTDNPVGTPMYFYAGFNIYKDKLAAGISVTTPYGSSLSWGKQWKGASVIQDIKLQSFFFQPTVSVKLAKGLSLGAGLVIATGNFELSRALMSAEKFQAIGTQLPADMQALVQRYKGFAPVSATLGGTSKVKVGYNVGIMYQPLKQLTIGVSYRSKIKMGLDSGDASLDYIHPDVQALIAGLAINNPELAKIPRMDKGTFSASLPLPSNLTIGIGYQPSERWLLAFDMQFVGWSAYKELVVHFNDVAASDGEVIEDIVSPKDYKNTISYRLGAQFSVTSRFDVRLGVYFDETPVRSYNYNPETPGANKFGISTGFSFVPYKNLSIDVAFTFIKGFKRNGSYTNPYVPGQTPDVFAGKYSSTAYIPSIGISYKF